MNRFQDIFDAQKARFASGVTRSYEWRVDQLDPRCGSPLTTEPDLTPDLMMVKAGTLDSNEWFRPVWELFVGRRHPRARWRSRRAS